MTLKQANQLKAKMREQKIVNFTDAELDRVFKNVVSPIACKRGTMLLLKQGLTIKSLYQEV